MDVSQDRTESCVRALDVVGAVTGLLLLSPVFLVLAAVVRLTSPGPAFFKALRIGRNGRLFAVIKFRSMVADAEAIGPAITAAGDHRVTHVGRLMRKLKLDELPQLLNVLQGDMSLVGPRPEDPRYVAHYSRDQLGVLRTRPGITSPASLRYRHEESELTGDDWEQRYISQIMPAKLTIDGQYIDQRTVLSDVSVIFGTLRTLCKARR